MPSETLGEPCVPKNEARTAVFQAQRSNSTSVGRKYDDILKGVIGYKRLRTGPEREFSASKVDPHASKAKGQPDQRQERTLNRAKI